MRKELLPVHRLKERRRRSNGRDGAEHCDSIRLKSCQHSRGRTVRQTDREDGLMELSGQLGKDGRTGGGVDGGAAETSVLRGQIPEKRRGDVSYILYVYLTSTYSV